MKKFKLILIMLFVFIFSVSIMSVSTMAKNYIPDGYAERGQGHIAIRYANGRVFNHISPNYNIDMDELRDEYKHCVEEYGIKGTFEFLSPLDVLKGNKAITTYLMLRIIIEDSIVKEIHYIFDDWEYYYLPISETATGEYTEFTGLDLNEYYGEEVKCKVNRTETVCSGITIYGSGNKTSVLSLTPLCYNDMYFICYSEDKKDNAITVDANNPISREEIVSKLGITNDQGTPLLDYEIIDYTYDPENLTPGKYTIKVRGIGDEYDIHIKDIVVYAKDYNPIELDNIFVPYYEELSSNDILDLITIYDDYEDISIKSDYFKNTTTIGGYDYIVTIYNHDTIYRKTSRIIVIDDIAPEINGPAYLETDTEHKLTRDMIKSHYVFTDNYTNEDMTIDFEELNNEDNIYENNFNLAGKYKIRIHAYDKFGNHGYKDIFIYVSDVVVVNPDITSSSENNTIVASSSKTSEYVEPSTTTPSTTTTTVIPSTTKESILPSSTATSTTTSKPTVAPSTTTTTTTSKSSSVTSVLTTTSVTPSITKPSTTSTSSKTSTTVQASSSSKTTVPSTSATSSSKTTTPSTTPTSSKTSTTTTPKTSSTTSTTSKQTSSSITPTASSNYWDQFVTSSSKQTSTTSVPSSSSKTTTIPKTSTTTTTPKTSSVTPSTTKTSNLPSSTTKSSTVTPTTSSNYWDQFKASTSTKSTTVDTPSTTTQNTSTKTSVDPTVTSESQTPKTTTTTVVPSTTKTTIAPVVPSTTMKPVIPSLTSTTEMTSKTSLDIIPSKTKIVIPDVTLSPTVEETSNETPNTSVEESTTKKTQVKRDEEFKLVTSVNNKLTIDSIKDSLLDSDIITEEEYDLVTIESNYFSTPDVKGEYLVTIKYPNGAKINYVLEVMGNTNAKEEKKDDYTLIYIIAGSSVVLLIIVVAVIIKVKKHEKKA